MSHRAEHILSSDLPAPKGHYSHAASGGGLLFISGQLPFIRDGNPAEIDFAEQARCALDNMLAVLKSAGRQPSDLVKVTAYIAGVEHWGAFNAVYAEVLGPVRPARTVVPVPELHYGFLIEIDAVAVA